MQHDSVIRTRRRSLVGLLGSGAVLYGLGIRLAVAEWLETPMQMAGPFYPVTLPLDRDNDLTTVAGRSERAKGDIIDVAGRVLGTDGAPASGVKVEIWQVDAFGRYGHPDDDQPQARDPGFQGYGHAITDAAGGYRFRTVRPVAYPGRAPHIHFGIGPQSGASFFFTQMYIEGAPENAKDFLLNGVRDSKARARLVVNLETSPNPGSRYAGRFDIVLDHTTLSRRLR